MGHRTLRSGTETLVLYRGGELGWVEEYRERRGEGKESTIWQNMSGIDIVVAWSFSPCLAVEPGMKLQAR
jgi:hypothetical protein